MIKLKSLVPEIQLDEKIVYHGTISDFVDQIQREKVIKSPQGGATKISGGLTTEMGMIWVTPEFDVANYFATGPEARSWIDGTVYKGLKADYGGVFEIEIDDNIRLIDRNAPLNQDQIDILNKKFIPHYKPLHVGDSLSSAEWRSNGKQLHDMVKALGYDGITYGNGKQIGIVADQLPIKAFHKKPIKEVDNLPSV